jgi:hypothetical protein
VTSDTACHATQPIAQHALTTTPPSGRMTGLATWSSASVSTNRSSGGICLKRGVKRCLSRITVFFAVHVHTHRKFSLMQFHKTEMQAYICFVVCLKSTCNTEECCILFPSRVKEICIRFSKGQKSVSCLPSLHYDD